MNLREAGLPHESTLTNFRPVKVVMSRMDVSRL